MKTIHALFLMGLIFGGMPVIAGEEGDSEDDRLIREVPDEERLAVLAKRKAAMEKADLDAIQQAASGLVRLRVAKPAAREQAALQAAQKAAMEAADFELARRLAMEEEDSDVESDKADPDVESDEDSDDPDASAGYGRQTAHGRPQLPRQAQRIAMEKADRALALGIASRLAGRQVAKPDARKKADSEAAQLIAMQQADSDGEGDEDSDDPDTSEDDGRQTTHGRPRGSQLRGQEKARQAAREESGLRVVRRIASEQADLRVAQLIAMQQADSDGEGDEDSDDTDESGGDGRQTAHGGLRGPQLRKPGCYGRSTLPGYVTILSSNEEPTKDAVRTMVRAVAIAKCNAKTGVRLLETVRSNIGMALRAMPNSAFYNKCDKAQQDRIRKTLEKAEIELASLEKASEESERLKTSEGVARRRNSIDPGYVTCWTDDKLKPSEAVKKLEDSLKGAMARVQRGRIFIDTVAENLEKALRVMPGSPLHGQLSQEQRDAIEEKLKKAKEKVGGLVEEAQRRDLREAQSGGMPKRLKTSGGGAAAGGGGGGC